MPSLNGTWCPRPESRIDRTHTLFISADSSGFASRWEEEGLKIGSNCRDGMAETRGLNRLAAMSRGVGSRWRLEKLKVLNQIEGG